MNKNFLLGGTILVLAVSVILTMKLLNNFEDNLDKEVIEKANNQIITENKPLTQEKSSFKDTLKEDTDINKPLVEEKEVSVVENEVIENKEEIIENSVVENEVIENKEEIIENKEEIIENKEESVVNNEESVVNNEESEEKEWSTFDKKEEPTKLEPIIVTPEDNSSNEETNEIINNEETNSENKNE